MSCCIYMPKGDNRAIKGKKVLSSPTQSILNFNLSRCGCRILPELLKSVFSFLSRVIDCTTSIDSYIVINRWDHHIYIQWFFRWWVDQYMGNWQSIRVGRISPRTLFRYHRMSPSNSLNQPLLDDDSQVWRLPVNNNICLVCLWSQQHK